MFLLKIYDAFFCFFVISSGHPKINFVLPKWDFQKKREQIVYFVIAPFSGSMLFRKWKRNHRAPGIWYKYQIQKKEQAESTLDTEKTNFLEE